MNNRQIIRWNKYDDSSYTSARPEAKNPMYGSWKERRVLIRTPDGEILMTNAVDAIQHWHKFEWVYIGDVEKLLDSPQTQPLRVRTKVQINAITTDSEASKYTCKRVVFHGRHVSSKFNFVCEADVLTDKVFSAFRNGKEINAIGYFSADDEKYFVVDEIVDDKESGNGK